MMMMMMAKMGWLHVLHVDVYEGRKKEIGYVA
jgi:hypothetical protein